MTKERQIQRIGEFIQRQLTRRQAGSQPDAIVLYHCHGWCPGQRLDSMKLSDMGPEYPAKTAGDLYAIAEDDTLGLGDAAQKYIVLSYSSGGMDSVGRCIFEVVVSVPQEQTATV